MADETYLIIEPIIGGLPMSAGNLHNLRQRGITLLSAILSLFILYTCATGPFESIIQRAIFLAILICLGVLIIRFGRVEQMAAAGDGRRRRDGPGVAYRLHLCHFNYDMIMTTLPMAKPQDIVMTTLLSFVVLEIARRAIGYVFPTIVVSSWHTPSSANTSRAAWAIAASTYTL